MNSFVLEEWSKEPRCTYYTVRWDEEADNETDLFFTKYKDNSKLARSIQELAVFLIVYIGQKKGALSHFFRFENNANALPPSGKYLVDEVQINYQNFPLRLYCLRLSENIVILFNGGEKTSQTAQGGKTSIAFREACAFTKRIDQAIKDKEIIILEDHGIILSEEDSDEIILH